MSSLKRIRTLPRRRARERGNLLAAVYISLIPVIGIITAFSMRTANEIHAHEARKSEVKATQRALAAMEVARNEIMNSTYTSANNDKIKTTLQQTNTSSLRPDLSGNGYLAIDLDTGERVSYYSLVGLPSNISPFKALRTVDLVDDVTGELDDSDDKVTIYIAHLTNLWHMIEARATVSGVSRTSRLLVRERDPFSRFGVFINSHYQGISGAPKGDIHTNRKLQIFYPGSVFDDFVSARDGFQWMIGATAGNTTFNGGYAAPTAQIAMPSLADVTNLKPFATGNYYIPNTYKDVQITFSGADVLIKATNKATNVVTTLHNGSLPPNGVIYAEENIKVLKGDVNGRVTVACASATGVKITGSLRYIDEDGDPAMLNPTTPANYTHNPDYEGNSTLGVISNGPVLYASTVPNTLELHGAIFSRTGNVGVPGLTFTSNGQYVSAYDSTFQKLNLNILGCTLADKRFVGSVVNGSGTVLSGFRDGYMEYDRTLLNTPPPHFLEIDRPMFKGVEIVENLVDV